MLVVFNISPFIAENVYSKGIYPFLALAMGFITDIVRFSITELLIVVSVLAIIVRFILVIYRLIRRQRTFKNVLLHFLRQLFIVISVIFVWFYFMWGFNYFRVSFEEKSDTISLEIKSDKMNEMFENTMLKIIDKVNELYFSNIARGESFEKTEQVVNEALFNTIKTLDKIEIRPAKKVKVSMTNALEQFTIGVISPFLLESHVSKELISAEIPFILAHEKSHLYGYAHETEANYIAFITCVTSKDVYLKYSGLSQILRYFLSEYRNNLKVKYINQAEEEYKTKFDDLEESIKKQYLQNAEDDYASVYNKLERGIRDEYMEQSKRTKKYESWLQDLLYNIYDLYLSANKVSGGMMAYSRVTQLILKTKNLDTLIDSEGATEEPTDENIIIDTID